jgi:hypothetical protein
MDSHVYRMAGGFRQLTKNGLKTARYQSKHVAEIATKLFC